VSVEQARRRWAAIALVRLAGVAGAMLGLVLAARSVDWPSKLLGVAIVLSALVIIAVVPAGLAHRWRSRDE